MGNNPLEVLESLNSVDTSLKMDALNNLYGSELDADVAAKVCGLLKDEDKGVRFSAAELLIQSQNTTVPACLCELISSEDISVRNLAGETLVRMGACSLDALITYLSSCTNTDDQKFAIDLLGLIGSSECEDVIVRILLSVDNENVTLACLETLGSVKSEKSVPVLIKMYGHNFLFNPAIVEALGKIGSADALNFMYSNYPQADELVKFAIIEGLGRIGDEETFFFLLSELNENKGALSWTILKSIFQLKTKYGFDIPFDEKMKNMVLDAITEADDETKEIALLMAAEFNDKESIFVCLKNYGLKENSNELLKDKLMQNPEFVLTNLPVILKQSPSNILPLLYLVQDLFSTNSGLKEQLKTVEYRDLIATLSETLNDPGEEVRSLSMELLFTLDVETGLLFAETIAEDASFWNRLKLLELAGEIDSPYAEKAIIKLTKDPEEMVSDRAFYYLKLKGIGIEQLNTELTDGSIE